MQKNELLYWLALASIPTLTSKIFKALEEQFPNFEELFNLSSYQLKAFNLCDTIIKQISNFALATWEAEINWYQKHNIDLITWKDPRYPPLLLQISNPPPLLFVKGDAQLLLQPQIAIVGSRKCSPSSYDIAYHFAAELAKHSLVITSGLALGIDSAAHRGALSVSGKTIAVLGCGVDYLYPKDQAKLRQEIMSDGALVSEFPRGVHPLAFHFPRRNRIVSGLCWGTLVVEADLRSGSLITARYAVEQNREVFAIPGSIFNPGSRGCHHLIRQGAKLVESTSEILEEAPFTLTKVDKLLSNSEKKDTSPLDDHQQKLLECIGHEVTDMDTLIRRCGKTPGQLASMLLILELKHYIYAVPGGYIRQRS
jgi:DNA processing protein